MENIENVTEYNVFHYSLREPLIAIAIILAGILIFMILNLICKNMVIARLDRICKALEIDDGSFERLRLLTAERKKFQHEVLERYGGKARARAQGAVENIAAQSNAKPGDTSSTDSMHSVNAYLKGSGRDIKDIEISMGRRFTDDTGLYTDASKSFILQTMQDTDAPRILVSMSALVLGSNNVTTILRALALTDATIDLYDDATGSYGVDGEELLKRMLDLDIRFDRIFSITDSILIDELGNYDFIFTAHSGIRSAIEVFLAVLQTLQK